jgi:hypothetical protein
MPAHVTCGDATEVVVAAPRREPNVEADGLALEELFTGLHRPRLQHERQQGDGGCGTLEKAHCRSLGQQESAQLVSGNVLNRH